MIRLKNTVLCLLALMILSAPAFAQKPFEGTIVYSIKMLGENADQMAAFMPESYEYSVKDHLLKFKMNGGMTAAMMGEFIVDGKAETAYMVKHNEQTVYKMPTEDEDEAEVGGEPQITKEDETIEIAGYQCQKYAVTKDMGNGEESTQYLWVTEEIQIEKPKKSKKMSGGNIFVDGIDGFPLKVMTETMGMTMIMTATTLDMTKLDKEEFEIPSNYEMKEFDPSSFMGGGR